jgi:hypothetical protein
MEQVNRAIFWANGLRLELEADTADDLQTQAADLAVAAPAILESLANVVDAGNAFDAFKKGADTSGTTAPRPPVNQGAQPGSSGVPNCKCNIPMSDVRGKTYTKGTKMGQPYPYSFYKSKDCRNNCDPVK